MRLIEEMMILANVAAAESLEKARMPLLYRIHEQPSQEKLLRVLRLSAHYRYQLRQGPGREAGHFQPHPRAGEAGAHGEIMNDVVLRTQAQAVYSPENVGHFGLNLQRYAHFTSPIRRYADLVVHRALIRALKLGDGGLSDCEIAKPRRNRRAHLACASAAPWRPNAIPPSATSRHS